MSDHDQSDTRKNEQGILSPEPEEMVRMAPELADKYKQVVFKINKGADKQAGKERKWSKTSIPGGAGGSGSGGSVTGAVSGGSVGGAVSPGSVPGGVEGEHAGVSAGPSAVSTGVEDRGKISSTMLSNMSSKSSRSSNREGSDTEDREHGVEFEVDDDDMDFPGAMKNRRASKGKRGKKDAKKVTFQGWDTGTLAPHLLQNLPTYPELAPQIRRDVDNFLSRKMSYRRVSIEPEDRRGLGSGDLGKEYLESHAIGEMFQMLLTGLLYHFPERPLDYLIDVVREMNHQRTQENAVEDLLTNRCADSEELFSSDSSFIWKRDPPNACHAQCYRTPPPPPPPSMVTNQTSDTDVMGSENYLGGGSDDDSSVKKEKEPSMKRIKEVVEYTDDES